MSMSNYSEQATLDALFNNAALQKSARYFQLHIGDPGENGTANAAVQTVRRPITDGPASGGVFTSVNALTWLSAPAAELYTHGSIWDDPTAGNCLWTGTLESPQSVEAADDFTIPVGELTVALD